jgi:hypothetical protein
MVVFVLLCLPPLLRATEPRAQRPANNTKPTFTFKKAVEEPPQKIHFEPAARIGTTPVEPDRPGRQHVVDFMRAAPRVSRVSSSPRAPPTPSSTV